ncbi:MAG: hypothetical protein NZO58_01295 [Gemmataceae bacterium]|nr:hypothetical protein [Gemmataceae bacterium]
MKDWVQWIIPVVALAAWIIHQLASSQQQQAKKAPAARPDDRPPAPPRRRASQELEQFLREAKQRKLRSVELAEDEVVVVAEPVELPPAAPIPQRTPVRRDPLPVRRVEPPRRVELAEAEAAGAVPLTPQAKVVEAPSSPPAPPPGPARPEDAYAQQGRLARRGVSPLAPLVRQLLSNRRSLQAAFVLRDILDRPLSKRRGRR